MSTENFAESSPKFLEQWSNIEAPSSMNTVKRRGDGWIVDIMESTSKLQNGCIKLSLELPDL